MLLIVFSIAAPMVWGVTSIFWAAPIADVLAIAVTAVVMLHLWNQLVDAPLDRRKQRS